MILPMMWPIFYCAMIVALYSPALMAGDRFYAEDYRIFFSGKKL
ncbi:hypothetical protein RF007C_05005 [Ruminococcus flavefaciens 007c]|uniref:Uncharacterized protein n=1 Tax=Ruminococcus flavefaciens 007c TaxID=1341157 RepID=W7UIG6_RUMFL|nr:hypothetical protein RF007C_05005 [Ruminococcus flavefaciens 007c]